MKKKNTFTILVVIFAGLASMVAYMLPHIINAANGDTIANESFSETFVDRIHEAWPWYVTRGAGFLSVLIMLLLILSGIGLVTGHTYKYLEPLKAWAFHRALGIALIASVLVHIFALLFDSYLPFNLLDILIPFVSNFGDGTIFGVEIRSIYMALGIVAFYGLLVIVVSSLIWIDKKPRAWKFIHYVSYITMAAVFFHGLHIGTDLKGGMGRVLWVIMGIIILVGLIARIWRAGTIMYQKSRIRQ